ncbi:MAG: nucleotidyltransferase domain-containing protein [Propionibacteriaceae bacterium]|jgi:predicted nucleotidyltransferase|nr:nucleotidyltransferase domain-containing protein [Propionibacteriaceae bacterium]
MSTVVAEKAAVRPSLSLRRHRSAVLRLIEETGAQNPRVFGSVARGEDTPDSNIDILVRVNPARAWDFVDLPNRLCHLLGTRVDVVSEGGITAKHAAIVAEAIPL